MKNLDLCIQGTDEVLFGSPNEQIYAAHEVLRRHDGRWQESHERFADDAMQQALLGGLTLVAGQGGWVARA